MEMNAFAKSRPARRASSATEVPAQAVDMRPHAARAAALLKALANPQRLMILCNLAGGELTVGDLIERLPLGQSATSQHLAVLREQGIVATRREAQTIHYSLQPGPAADVIAVLHDIYCGTPSRPGRGPQLAPSASRGKPGRPPARR
jgi:ArsR family transcriptional regulator, virulence genes transcriptional regulator